MSSKKVHRKTIEKHKKEWKITSDWWVKCETLRKELSSDYDTEASWLYFLGTDKKEDKSIWNKNNETSNTKSEEKWDSGVDNELWLQILSALLKINKTLEEMASLKKTEKQDIRISHRMHEEPDTLKSVDQYRLEASKNIKKNYTIVYKDKDWWIGQYWQYKSKNAAEEKAKLMKYENYIIRTLNTA